MNQIKKMLFECELAQMNKKITKWDAPMRLGIAVKCLKAITECPIHCIDQIKESKETGVNMLKVARKYIDEIEEAIKLRS